MAKGSAFKDTTYVRIEDEDPLSFRSIHSYESAFAFTKGSAVGHLNEREFQCAFVLQIKII